MEPEKKTLQGVTKEQLRAGEEGLVRLLFTKRFSREWIERHVPEVMAQAQTDLAKCLANEHVRDAVALLVVVAYRRALKIVRAEATGPRIVSLEEKVVHLADESAKTPEEEAIGKERQVRLLRAIGHLPEREQKLLALVYFGGLTAKEAGRQLGWSPSSAIRHQRAALEKLRALVGERALLGTEIAVPAFVASSYTLPKGPIASWLEAAANSARDLVTLAAHRWAPVAEAGNALALGGAGRTTAGVCGLAVAACLTAVGSGVVGPGVSALDAEPPRPEQKILTPRRSEFRERSRIEQHLRSWAPISGAASGFRGSAAGGGSDADRRGAGPPAGHRGDPETAPPPQRAPEKSVAEFGVEGGEPEAPMEPAASAESASPIQPASAAPAPSPPPSGAAPSTESSEFGM